MYVLCYLLLCYLCIIYWLNVEYKISKYFNVASALEVLVMDCEAGIINLDLLFMIGKNN